MLSRLVELQQLAVQQRRDSNTHAHTHADGPREVQLGKDGDPYTNYHVERDHDPAPSLAVVGRVVAQAVEVRQVLAEEDGLVVRTKEIEGPGDRVAPVGARDRRKKRAEERAASDLVPVPLRPKRGVQSAAPGSLLHLTKVLHAKVTVLAGVMDHGAQPGKRQLRAGARLVVQAHVAREVSPALVATAPVAPVDHGQGNNLAGRAAAAAEMPPAI